MLVVGFWLSMGSFADQGKPGPEQPSWWMAMGDGRRCKQLTENGSVFVKSETCNHVWAKQKVEREQYSRHVHTKLGGDHKQTWGL